MAASAVSGIAPHHSRLALPAATTGRQIHRQHHRRAARPLRTADQFPRYVPASGRIELVPERRAAGTRNVADWCRTHAGQHLQTTGAACRPCGRQLAIGMKAALRTDRTEHDRAGMRFTEQRHRRVNAGDVNQPPRTQIVAIERGAVRQQGLLAERAGRDIAIVRRRQHFARRFAEIEHVDGQSGVGDRLGAVLLRQRARKPFQRRQYGTRRKEFEKPPPGVGLRRRVSEQSALRRHRSVAAFPKPTFE